MNDSNVKLLPVTFSGRGETKGFNFTQIINGKKSYVYRVEDSGRIYYEVIVKKINKQFNCESYPGSKGFGSLGFTFNNLDSAKVKFNELNEME